MLTDVLKAEILHHGKPTTFYRQFICSLFLLTHVRCQTSWPLHFASPPVFPVFFPYFELSVFPYLFHFLACCLSQTALCYTPFFLKPDAPQNFPLYRFPLECIESYFLYASAGAVFHLPSYFPTISTPVPSSHSNHSHSFFIKSTATTTTVFPPYFCTSVGIQYQVRSHKRVRRFSIRGVAYSFFPRKS